MRTVASMFVPQFPRELFWADSLEPALGQRKPGILQPLLERIRRLKCNWHSSRLGGP